MICYIFLMIQMSACNKYLEAPIERLEHSANRAEWFKHKTKS